MHHIPPTRHLRALAPSSTSDPHNKIPDRGVATTSGDLGRIHASLLRCDRLRPHLGSSSDPVVEGSGMLPTDCPRVKANPVAVSPSYVAVNGRPLVEGPQMIVTRVGRVKHRWTSLDAGAEAMEKVGFAIRRAQFPSAGPVPRRMVLREAAKVLVRLVSSMTVPSRSRTVRRTVAVNPS